MRHLITTVSEKREEDKKQEEWNHALACYDYRKLNFLCVRCGRPLNRKIETLVCNHANKKRMAGCKKQHISNCPYIPKAVFLHSGSVK